LRAFSLIFLALLVGSEAQAQDSLPPPAWSVDASLWAYIVPDSPDFLSVTVLADHDWLHLEGRYNYEAIETASFWVGYNFRVDRKISLFFTPMVGGLVGSIDGAAPGYELTIDWWKLEFDSSSEYVIDFDDSSENFFYTWSQLGIFPVEWLQLGVAVQRTQAYESPRDIQRGLFASAEWRRLNAGLYVFNPDDTPSWILSVGATF
jgi:hypothetical protein